MYIVIKREYSSFWKTGVQNFKNSSTLIASHGGDYVAHDIKFDYLLM